MEPNYPISKQKKQSFVSKLRGLLSLKIRIVLVIVGIAGLGVYFLRGSFANTTTSNVDCGKLKLPYSYQVPWGNAVWNQNVCNLPRFTQSADYVNRLIEWGHVNDGSQSADVANGKISTDPGFLTPQDPNGNNLYTTEIYYASKATTFSKKVWSVASPSNLDGSKWQPAGSLARPGYISNFPDTPIPWNNNWKTSKGGDNQMLIIDDRAGSATYGSIISFWGNNNSCLLQPSYACASSVRITRDHYGELIDYRTYEGYTGDRGVGLSYYATLTTADEVAAGQIRHALGVSIPNPSNGPKCSASQLQTNNWTSVIGKSCGTAVAPASKFEWADTIGPPFLQEPFKSIYTQEKLIPEGMRFAIDVTDTEIEQWIQSRSDLASNARRAETARIFAKALRNYGMFVVDTNAGRVSVQTEGGINPESRTKWESLAMGPEYKDNLLDGLLTKENMYVVEPPKLTCPDENITSKFYCKWTEAKYETTGDSIKPTVAIAAPASNATVSASVAISGSASDNVGVNRIEVLVGSTQLYSVTSNSNYSYNWDSRSVANGSHTITVRAYDVAGNVGSITRTVNVSNTGPAPVQTADFNRDSKVNLTDLSILLTNYGKTVSASTNGDATGDGKVGLIDLSVLLSQYGK